MSTRFKKGDVSITPVIAAAIFWTIAYLFNTIGGLVTLNHSEELAVCFASTFMVLLAIIMTLLVLIWAFPQPMTPKEIEEEDSKKNPVDLTRPTGS